MKYFTLRYLKISRFFENYFKTPFEIFHETFNIHYEVTFEHDKSIHSQYCTGVTYSSLHDNMRLASTDLLT